MWHHCGSSSPGLRTTGREKVGQAVCLSCLDGGCSQQQVCAEELQPERSVRFRGSRRGPLLKSQGMGDIWVGGFKKLCFFQ